MALGAAIARDHITHGVVAHMAHMDAPGRIREHLEHVVFRARIVGAGREGFRLVPAFLPTGFGFAEIVAARAHLWGLRL